MAKGSAAQKAPPAREAVTATGNDLLQLISDNGGMYLLPSEAAEANAAGHISVNTNDLGPDGATAMVTLTDAGEAALASGNESEVQTSGKVKFEIDDDVPMPAIKKESGRRGSKYPFDDLKPGQSFHIAATAKVPNPLASLASSLTVARRRYEIAAVDANGNPIMETVKVKNYKLDASGKRVKGPDDKFIVESEQAVQRQKRTATREFTAHVVGKDDPRGAGVRVYRQK